MITHVVFDFDGTLADSLKVAVQLYNEFAEKNGYGKFPDDVEEFRTMSIPERIKRLGIPFYKLPIVVTQVRRSLRHAMDHIEFNEGIPELLKELRERGLRIIILSTNDRENIQAFLKRHSAEQWVDDIYGGGGIFGKARRLRDLMKHTGLQRHQLVYVGDELRDVEACKEVGVKVIAVRWGADAEGPLRQAGPDSIADRPADIAECVGRWLAMTPAAP